MEKIISRLIREGIYFEMDTTQGYLYVGASPMGTSGKAGHKKLPALFLLGYIVEKVSGQYFGEYLRRNVFDETGMKNTGIDNNDSVLKKKTEGL